LPADRDVPTGDTGIDGRRRLHDAVELDRYLLVHVRRRDLLHEVVVLEVHVDDPRRGRRIDDGGRGSDVATGEDRRAEGVAEVAIEVGQNDFLVGNVGGHEPAVAARPG